MSKILKLVKVATESYIEQILYFGANYSFLKIKKLTGFLPLVKALNLTNEFFHMLNSGFIC